VAVSGETNSNEPAQIEAGVTELVMLGGKTILFGMVLELLNQVHPEQMVAIKAIAMVCLMLTASSYVCVERTAVIDTILQLAASGLGGKVPLRQFFSFSLFGMLVCFVMY
jgi:hypothetical protein